jgi:tyrosyl-tRNA synthetase
VENVFDTLESRGFVEQFTDRTLVRELVQRPITCYIGFDPTAKSLHVGNLLPIMALVQMQGAGHRPIVLVGGGTALIGDPSGKTEMRPVMTREEINENAESIKKQLSRFIDFSDGKAILVNNADWLTGLGYIDFLRDIGRHFSVNRMLTAESYKARLETGLNFIEFNYMLLQAYDFWHLFKQYDCQLQLGGNDQWGNILAGADLTRRLEKKIVHGLTLPLLITSSGVKMGKTHKGAVWLDPELTTPYHFYQYWINQDDRDVERFLSLYTFLPMDEIHRLCKMEHADIRATKALLAYEATKICHGGKAAEQARADSILLFGKNETAESPISAPMDDLEPVHGPTYGIDPGKLAEGIPAYLLFEQSGLCKTRSDARRLISQGGGYINSQRIQNFDQAINLKYLENGALLLRAGKKRFMRIILASYWPPATHQNGT